MPSRGSRVVALSGRSLGLLVMVLGAVVLGGVLITSTGAFSSVTAPRDVNIGIAEDRAPIELTHGETAIVGQRSRLVTVTNNLDRQVRVTVTLTNRQTGKLFVNGRMADGQISTDLPPGETVTVAVRANNRAEAIRYTVTATGAGLSIEFPQHSIPVMTPGGPPDGGQPGGGEEDGDGNGPPSDGGQPGEGEDDGDGNGPS